MMRRRDCLLSFGLAVPAVAMAAGGLGSGTVTGRCQSDSPVTLPHSSAWQMSSVDGQRHYRIMMALPSAPTPPQGWPVIYVLDGNAFFATVVEAVRLEAFMAGYPPAVVVGVGYNVDGPIDVVSRNFDYAPPTQAPPEYDDRNPTRRAGGADIFIDFLRRQLIPAIAARVQVDPVQSFLFGHSYGGLFSVYCFLKDSRLFSAIAAASPSLWYKHGYVLSLAGATMDQDKPGGRLLLMAGENEQRLDADEIAFMGEQRAATMAALKQVDHVVDLVHSLAASGVEARSHVFEGETHVSVVPGAISRAVRFFLHRTPTQPGTPR